MTSYQATTTQNQSAIISQSSSLSFVGKELFSDFIDYLSLTKETSKKTYLKALKVFSNWLSENGISSPTRADLNAYRDHLRQTCKPATTQLYILVVRKFYEWLDLEDITKDIAKGIKGAKVSSHSEKIALTPAQELALLNSIDRTTIQGLRDYAMIRLALMNGLRTIEIQRALVSDLETIENTRIIYLHGKGHDTKDQYAPIGSKVEMAINEYLRARGKLDQYAPLFASHSDRNEGQAMRTESISRIVKTHLRAIGLDSERLTAHSLRHTCITKVFKKTRSIETAQEVARHESSATTKRYIHCIKRLENKSEIMLDDELE